MVYFTNNCSINNLRNIKSLYDNPKSKKWLNKFSSKLNSNPT